MEVSVQTPIVCLTKYSSKTLILSSEGRKHVFRDLRPYVCLSAACVAADQDFQRRKDWSRHMLQEHWRQWACPLGCAAKSSSPLGLRQHLKDFHGTVSSDKNIDFIISQSSRPDPQHSHGICPLCNDVEIKSNHQYRSHIGHHLEQLALFVLPAHEYDSADDEDENSNRSAHDTEEEDETSSQNEYEPRDFVSSYWSVADQSEFLDLFKRFGQDWLSISRHMRTKTETMVSFHPSSFDSDFTGLILIFEQVRNYFNKRIEENPGWQHIADGASSSNATAINEDIPRPEPTPFEEPSAEWVNIDGDVDAMGQGFKEYHLSDQGTSGSAQRAPTGSSGMRQLHGGIAVNGRPAELISIDKDGRAISHAIGEVVDVNRNIESDSRIKRPHSEELADEDEIARSLARRRKNAGPEELEPKKCREPGCTREFNRACDLTKHEKTHTRPWKCPVESCKYHEYGWPTETEMDRHCDDKHSIDPPMYKCLFAPCPYKSKRESNCKQHMEKAHGWRYVRTKTIESKKGGSKAGSGID